MVFVSSDLHDISPLKSKESKIDVIGLLFVRMDAILVYRFIRLIRLIDSFISSFLLLPSLIQIIKVQRYFASSWQSHRCIHTNICRKLYLQLQKTRKLMEKTGSPAWTKGNGDEQEQHGNGISVWRYTLRSRHAICKKKQLLAPILLLILKSFSTFSWSAIVKYLILLKREW